MVAEDLSSMARERDFFERESILDEHSVQMSSILTGEAEVKAAVCQWARQPDRRSQHRPGSEHTRTAQSRGLRLACEANSRL